MKPPAVEAAGSKDEQLADKLQITKESSEPGHADTSGNDPIVKEPGQADASSPKEEAAVTELLQVTTAAAASVHVMVTPQKPPGKLKDARQCWP